MTPSHETPAPQSATQIHETLYDGADLTVAYRDGSSESVKVRKISRAEFAVYATHMNNEEDECAFYVAGKGAVWAADLNDESFDAVLREGQRLNFTRFVNWFERQTNKLQLVKGNNALTQKAMALIAEDPSLKKLLGSTNGSSPRDIPTATSGAIPQRN